METNLKKEYKIQMNIFHLEETLTVKEIYPDIKEI